MSDSQSLLCPAGVGRSKPTDDPIKVAFIGILALGSELTRQLWVQFAQDVAKVSQCYKIKILCIFSS